MTPAATLPGYVPLTRFRAAMLLARAQMTEIHAADLTPTVEWQIGREQGSWKRLESAVTACGTGLWCLNTNPSQPAFFEWQAFSGQKSGRATEVLDALMGSEGPSARLGAFVFSRAAIVGREAGFAAHELQSVYKQLIAAAVARTPTKVLITLPVESYRYDFDRKGLVVAAGGRNASRDNQPGDLLDPITRALYDDEVKVDAGSRAVYFLGLAGFTREDEDDTPAYTWRSLPKWPLPSPTLLATDRQLHLDVLSVSAQRAEALVKSHSTLTVRIYVTMEQPSVVEPWINPRTRRQEVPAMGMLTAHVDRVDVGAPEEIVASVMPEKLISGPLGGAAPAAAGGAAPSGLGPNATTDQIRAKIKVAEEARTKADAELTKLRQDLALACQQIAASAGEKGTPAYSRSYAACLNAR